MSTPSCQRCRFLEAQKGRPALGGPSPIVVGTCRRRAPEFQASGPYARWPEVTDRDWCGEFSDANLMLPELMICPHGFVGTSCHICLAQQLGRYIVVR